MSGAPDIAAAVASIDEQRLQPIVRKAADEFYESVMNAVQDYLRDNAEYNIGSYISTLEREAQSSRAEVHRQAGCIAELVEALTWALAELRGQTRYDNPQQELNCFDNADDALAKVKGETA